MESYTSLLAGILNTTAESCGHGDLMDLDKGEAQSHCADER